MQRKRWTSKIALCLLFVSTIVLADISSDITITPNSGPPTGGTSVTLTGVGLTGTTAVTFGGTPAISLIVADDTTITAVTPAYTAGTTATVYVVVTTQEGDVQLSNQYTYVAPQ